MTLTPEQIEHRRLWTDDLRNGGHKQVQAVLEITGVGFCCHGRACRVAMAHGIDLAVSADRDYEVVEFEGQDDLPPESVYADWLGFTWSQTIELAGLNDEGQSFTAIADIVDEWTAAGR